MKIRILTAGKLRKSPLSDLCAEYLKRMHWSVTLTETAETLTLKDLPDPAFLIALDERGESLSSSEFATHIQKWQQRAPSNTLTFAIGGADGFDNAVRTQAQFLLSFGKQTWPHMLVRVMLLEQIYRAQQIIAGHPYHRA